MDLYVLENAEQGLTEFCSLSVCLCVYPWQKKVTSADEELAECSRNKPWHKLVSTRI